MGFFVILSQDRPVCFYSKSTKVSLTLFVGADLHCPSQVSQVEQKELRGEINREIFKINSVSCSNLT